MKGGGISCLSCDTQQPQYHCITDTGLCPTEKKTIKPSQKNLMVSTSNAIINITNHQLLTIKTFFFSVVCFGTYSIRIYWF